MRNVLALGLVLGGVTVLAQAQQPWVEIVDGQNRSGVAVVQTGPYDTAPRASITAKPQKPGGATSADAFGIRAWREGEQFRVVVFAVTRHFEMGRPTETIGAQIATRLLGPNESTEINETAQYGARPVTIASVFK